MRRLNPANPDPTAQGGILDSTWTDHDLDGSAYGDYQVAVGGSVTELQRYVPGLADIIFRWWEDDPDYDPWGGWGSGGY